MSRLADVLRMIKFEHSVFALPFALSGAWLAAGGTPPWRDLGWIVLAAVAARSAAMAFNRLVDRALDAENPRTAGRELPRGVLSPGFAALFTAVCAGVFVAAAFALGPYCGWLSLPVLAVLLGYSYLKRWSWLCHFVLGLALACAPLGAWLAVAKEFRADWPVPAFVGAGVLLWVGGFDLLYALQDLEFDRRRGLASIPARFGAAATLPLARQAHAGALLCFVLAGFLSRRGAGYYAGVAAIAGLLAYEHALVRDLRRERIPQAFFDVNAWVGVAFFAGLWLDLRAGAAA